MISDPRVADQSCDFPAQSTINNSRSLIGPLTLTLSLGAREQLPKVRVVARLRGKYRARIFRELDYGPITGCSGDKLQLARSDHLQLPTRINRNLTGLFGQGARCHLAARPPDEDAIDLLSVAGFPVLKRALPAAGVVAAFVLLLLLGRRRRRRRGSGTA